MHHRTRQNSTPKQRKRLRSIGMEEEAGGGVGADDAYGLEVGVDYGGANEFHAAVLEVV